MIDCRVVLGSGRPVGPVASPDPSMEETNQDAAAAAPTVGWSVSGGGGAADAATFAARRRTAVSVAEIVGRIRMSHLWCRATRAGGAPAG